MGDQQQQKGVPGANPSRGPITSGIRYPGPNAVMFGRGGETNYHIGNSRFRFFAEQYKSRYQAATRQERHAIAREVVDRWRLQNPPGLFLTRSEPSKGDESLWEDVGDKVALRKAAKILGEGVAGKKKKAEKDDSSDSRKRSKVPSEGHRISPSGTRRTSNSLASAPQANFVNDPFDSSFVQIPHQFSQPYYISTNLAAASDFQHQNFVDATAGGTATGRSRQPQGRNSSRPPEKAGTENAITAISTINPGNVIPPVVNPEAVPVAASLTGVFGDSGSSESGDSHEF